MYEVKGDIFPEAKEELADLPGIMQPPQQAALMVRFDRVQTHIFWQG
jgi:hypothetical protein